MSVGTTAGDGHAAKAAEAGSADSASRPAGPDFLCVGAQKAGTQWLYDQLALHPAFWMPPLKELHHFDLPGTRVKKARRMLRRARKDPEGFNAERAEARRRPLDERDLGFLEAFVALADTVDLDRYARLFEARGESLSGDITPGYSGLDERTIRKILARFPDIRVIYIARNPVDRFWSALNMRIRRGDVGPEPAVADIRKFARWRGVKRRSSPSATVRRWRGAMPLGSFGLFFFDDLAARPAEFRRDLLAFLGTRPEEGAPLDVDFNRKESRSKQPMSEALGIAVAEIFAEELKACAAELGGPAVDWAKAYGI